MAEADHRLLALRFIQLEKRRAIRRAPGHDAAIGIDGAGRETRDCLPMPCRLPTNCGTRAPRVSKHGKPIFDRKLHARTGSLLIDHAPPMLIGYAWVATHDQNLDLQRDALKAAGCERVIVEKMSGAASARPGLAQLKDILRAGDTLVVWRLDRLGRSLRDLIDWVGYLDDKHVGLRSLHEAIDTTSPTGKLTFHIFGALAEFERTLIRDRTQAGLSAARARGRKGGRPPRLNKDKRELAIRLYNERQVPIARICAMMGISKPTLYAYVRAADPGKVEPDPA